MVQKVQGGHNCWLANNDACADILTTWISAWAGASVAGGTSGVALKAPCAQGSGLEQELPGVAGAVPDDGVPAPARSTARAATRRPRPRRQSPFFASSDVDEAYAAVKVKINLDQPALSRLVVRLRNEFHNCWSDCAANSTTMEAAITAFANQVPVTQIDSSLVVSKAMKLPDGIVASGGNRYTRTSSACGSSRRVAARSSTTRAVSSRR
jgi:hypothetical protein